MGKESLHGLKQVLDIRPGGPRLSRILVKIGIGGANQAVSKPGNDEKESLVDS